MAANAYVLLTVDPPRTQAVVERLKTIRGAIVHEVTGPYDIVLELEADTPEDLSAVLRHKIRSIAGVTSSVTCMWIG